MNNFFTLVTLGHVGPEVKPGQIWRRDGSDSNPFDKDGWIKVAEVKDNWVHAKPMDINFDVYMDYKIANFRFLYTLIKDVE